MTVVRPCIERGCPQLVELGETRCSRHKEEWQRRRQEQGFTGARGTSAEWRRMRQQALERDGFACTKCGSLGPLVVHHVNGEPLDNRLGNLATLCEECHRLEHGARPTWRQREAGRKGAQNSRPA